MLELEIGAGVGWHAIRRAKENPASTLIAIEHGEERFSKFVSRLKNHAPLSNLFAIQADATVWSRKNLPAQCLDRVFILYPNPCAKKKLTQLRWFRRRFMANLICMLKPSGQIILATNKKDYFDEAKLWGLKYWKLQIVEERTIVVKDLPKGYPRTHFEKKYLNRGETCFEVVFSKA